VSLRAKTLLIVTMTLVGLFIALYVIARATILHRFREIEAQQKAEEKAERAQEESKKEVRLRGRSFRQESGNKAQKAFQAQQKKYDKYM